jgi:hypothetical protein
MTAAKLRLFKDCAKDRQVFNWNTASQIPLKALLCHRNDALRPVCPGNFRDLFLRSE